ncbi:hypothetical protein K0817_009365 [Microbacterium sp. HD4P20]|uniref:hypothetical protein n=1 Tax=Microbacterium sp. HD4P20 TaxID=2864874 RepID=UPI0020A29315|nr:hypothetical protein [Microbacterium sp. HD4P20]MCP2636772.1 hypothetical protein [Microbacterium sp. HD4P20]
MLAAAAEKRGLAKPCDEYVAPFDNAEVSAALKALEAGRDYFAGRECTESGHESARHPATDKQAGWLYKVALEHRLKPLDKAWVIKNLSADEVRGLVADIEKGNDPLASLHARADAAWPETAHRTPPPSRTVADTDVIDVLRSIESAVKRIADRLEAGR